MLEWWHWLIFGLILIAAELLLPIFVLVWFGLGAVLLALFMLIVSSLSLTAQVLIWLVASLAMVVLWFRLFKRDRHKTYIGMSDANVVGEIGLLTHAVDVYQRGEVRFQKPILGADVWSCVADGAIDSGERVKIISVEGSFLKIERA